MDLLTTLTKATTVCKLNMARGFWSDWVLDRDTPCPPCSQKPYQKEAPFMNLQYRKRIRTCSQQGGCIGESEKLEPCDFIPICRKLIFLVILLNFFSKNGCLGRMVKLWTSRNTITCEKMPRRFVNCKKKNCLKFWKIATGDHGPARLKFEIKVLQLWLREKAANKVKI